MSRQTHWQRVYAGKSPVEASWYRPHLDTSLALIEAAGVASTSRIIDVGGGASTLVDDLLAAGYCSPTVLDISAQALAVARRRLGELGASVHWLEGDITEVQLGRGTFELWHDRATLHFLIDEDERHRYAKSLNRALVPGGHAILGTFAPDGPPRCSGLPVRRYDAGMMQALLGEEFELRQERREVHRTPSGNEQMFTYGWLQKRAAGVRKTTGVTTSVRGS